MRSVLFGPFDFANPQSGSRSGSQSWDPGYLVQPWEYHTESCGRSQESRKQQLAPSLQSGTYVNRVPQLLSLSCPLPFSHCQHGEHHPSRSKRVEGERNAWIVAYVDVGLGRMEAGASK